MRYSTGPKFRKYVKGYSFLLFARKFGDKYGKKLMETATKTVNKESRRNLHSTRKNHQIIDDLKLF